MFTCVPDRPESTLIGVTVRSTCISRWAGSNIGMKPTPETFSDVLNDFIQKSGLSERQLQLRAEIHPTTFGQMLCGDPGNKQTLMRLRKLQLDELWFHRFLMALIVQDYGEDVVREAGLLRNDTAMYASGNRG